LISLNSGMGIPEFRDVKNTLFSGIVQFEYLV